ncbi:MAG TPA: N-acetylmuramoyl-L-alanine amidase [Candidatus Sulfotelmatobacter sp.]|nr:N-acetylmuramoyl-L-alanine amidase [Candidatus Sulfotelmatobacter sp.]
MSQRGMGWGALLLLLALPGAAAHARAHHGQSHHSEAWAREHFAAAERMREALNGRPLADRSRRDYQRVLNSYRNVYFGAPTSAKADPSVVAVAETLVEMGRRFDDDKILNEAIAQYRFLRREYPGSRYRCDALFTIGEIYKDDLNDPQQARTVFEEFLHRYPHNRLVEDAQQAVAELDRQAEAEKKEAEKKVEAQHKPAKDTADKNRGSKDSAAKDSDASGDAAVAESQARHASHLPRVTGIRHWSTPDYTRVAIDLENEVKFVSQRIADPDRIFFDLRDTKLASTLVGKSFDVDDGFLKKIRVAQFQPGRTRVVLEVDDLSDYEAFLLPNPYRLIIDIHGKDIHGKDGKVARGKAPPTTADVEAAPKAGKAADGDEDVAPKSTAASAKPDASAAAAQSVSAAKTAGGVKKVIVEADEEDSSPAQAAKLDSAAGRSHSPAARKTDSTPDSDVSTAEEKPATDAPATSHARGKSSTRLASAGNGADADIHEARPTASGDRSLIRALGLKIGRIVIDPGHGGHDTGTIGPNGLEEKDLVLEVGRRLGKLLESRLGAEVVYTRKDDTFIPLETRTAIANQQRADLFISIHANSSRDPAARGVETYYLNFTSSPEALEVAARENAVSEKSIYELQDLVKKIALKEKIEESREFAGDVQDSLHSGLAAKSPGIRNRGVKKAPFIVLIGANMPSILAEISFVSNPGDEHRLETGDYRQRIAESLYRGIAKYVNGLSGVKVAAKMDKASGQ